MFYEEEQTRNNDRFLHRRAMFMICQTRVLGIGDLIALKYSLHFCTVQRYSFNFDRKKAIVRIQQRRRFREDFFTFILTNVRSFKKRRNLHKHTSQSHSFSPFKFHGQQNHFIPELESLNVTKSNSRALNHSHHG